MYSTKKLRSLISQGLPSESVVGCLTPGNQRDSASRPVIALEGSESVVCVWLGEAAEKQADGRGDVSSHVGNSGTAYLCRLLAYN